MIHDLKRACLLAAFVLTAAVVSAQTSFSGIDSEVAKVLLTKDINQAIREAEARPSNDLRSLFWRLSLYRRAAHMAKVEVAAKQILTEAESVKVSHAIAQQLLPVIKDPHFTNTEVLQRFLRTDFNDEVFGRLIELCTRNRDKCDVSGFDSWLEQKARDSEPAKGELAVPDAHINWIGYRIDWRKRLGLDISGILNRLADDVRNDPRDLDKALRFVRFNKNAQDLSWLAETFSSENAYDFFELGAVIATDHCCTPLPTDEQALTHQAAVHLLLKSLSTPSSGDDVSRMYSYRLRHVSAPPSIKNHEKQLRFWTKTELAEVYKKMGRAQDAQPIVEELMNTDTSDIIAYKPSQLAGNVQAASGARVIESKILAERATRQTSYEYWGEQIQYYLGRKEPERVVDAYLQAFDSVPFSLNDRRTSGERSHYIRRFVDFANGTHFYLSTGDVNDWGELKKRIRAKAEAFLRDEFERTKANTRYAHDLVEIIGDSELDRLLDEILIKNAQLVVDAAEMDLIGSHSDLAYRFFNSEAVPRSSKDAVFEKLASIAEKRGPLKALALCEALKNYGPPSYAARVVPILTKNLKAAERKVVHPGIGRDDDEASSRIVEKYEEVLFDAHLRSGDWASAEKHLMARYSSIYYSPFERLAVTAAKTGAFADAARFWKMKANLNRRDLNNLSTIAAHGPVASELRAFYKQMSIDEPYSPVPEAALKILK